jgi:stress-induced morphogen
MQWVVATGATIKCAGIYNASSEFDTKSMITPDMLTDYIRRAIPNAKVSVTDRTGTMDHFSIRVVSDLFNGKNLLDRHRLIYNALNEPMKDGRIHALEIKAETTDGG